MKPIIRESPPPSFFIPFGQLEGETCVDIPVTDNIKNTRSRIQNALGKYNKENKEIKILTRTIELDGEKFIRVWRKPEMI